MSMLMMMMLRPARGSALRRPAPASRFSRSPGCSDAIRRMCSSTLNGAKRNKTPELLFVAVAAISMATYAYMVRGRTFLGYTLEVEKEQIKVDKENV